MTAMSIIYVIFIKDIFSTNLITIPDIKDKLDKEIFNLPYGEIVVNFSGVNTIDLDFVNYYLSNKSKSGKVIHEVNLPLWLQNVFDGVKAQILLNAT